MPMFTLNRAYTLRSTLGHIVNFVKGEPVYVPPALINEVVAIGAERSDGEAVDVLGPEEVVAAPMTLDERTTLINDAFATIVGVNDADDFTAQGIPKVGVVEKMTGTKFDKNEVMTAWQKFREVE